MSSCITKSFVQGSPNLSISSKRLLAVGERKRSGLVLCREYYAEFVGPGAAIYPASATSFAQVIAIGSPEIIEVTTYADRQQAYGRRIQWVRWLHRIVAEAEPTQRAEKLFAGFEEFFGSEILAKIPDEVLALLAGVLPSTIGKLRSQQQHIERADGPHCPLSLSDLEVSVVSLNGKTLPDLESFYPLPLHVSAFKATPVLPCSA